MTKSSDEAAELKKKQQFCTHQELEFSSMATTLVCKECGLVYGALDAKGMRNYNYHTRAFILNGDRRIAARKKLVTPAKK